MNEFVLRMTERQEMTQRLMEGPAKYLRENETTIITRRMHAASTSVDPDRSSRRLGRSTLRS